jgi:multicomponent Na+:H+ antiporter subunit E
MLQAIVLAAPLAAGWTLITDNLSLANLIVGYLLGIAIAALVAPRAIIRPARLPLQVFSLVIYTLELFRDILFSSIDIARRILSRDMRLKPGIIAVDTQDAGERELIAGLSAHSITITPGEMVIDFEGNHTMYVHCLNVDEALQTLDTEQAQRLKLINRILGGDGHE